MNKYLILNFKAYSETSGNNSLEKAAILDGIQTPEDLQIVICPQATDMCLIHSNFPNLTIWAQHTDGVEPGKHTGRLTTEAYLSVGATGTLINHSERPLSGETLEQVMTVTSSHDYKRCVCVKDSEVGLAVNKYEPELIAFEPPELISTPNSLIDTDPQIAESFVAALADSSAKLILGAGVRDAQDVKAALEMGYSGVLLASGFAKSDNPRQFIEDMLIAFT